MAGTLSMHVPVVAAAVPAAGLPQPVAHSLRRAALVPLRVRRAAARTSKEGRRHTRRAPDLTEDERVALTERYEEFLVAGGALDVEIFNRGMQPLAYSIKTKNMGGVMSRYLDGIFFLFIFAARSEAQVNLQQRLNRDDDVIRSTTFRLKA
ncbi:unnamed protein product [Closterium sp. Yama58-4]|nr:unnamed protein product [Closterium sp. Yama58-4]